MEKCYEVSIEEKPYSCIYLASQIGLLCFRPVEGISVNINQQVEEAWRDALALDFIGVLTENTEGFVLGCEDNNTRRVDHTIHALRSPAPPENFTFSFPSGALKITWD